MLGPAVEGIKISGGFDRTAQVKNVQKVQESKTKISIRAHATSDEISSFSFPMPQLLTILLLTNSQAYDTHQVLLRREESKNTHLTY